MNGEKGKLHKRFFFSDKLVKEIAEKEGIREMPARQAVVAFLDRKTMKVEMTMFFSPKGKSTPAWQEALAISLPSVPKSLRDAEALKNAMEFAEKVKANKAAARTTEAEKKAKKNDKKNAKKEAGKKAA